LGQRARRLGDDQPQRHVLGRRSHAQGRAVEEVGQGVDPDVARRREIRPTVGAENELDAEGTEGHQRLVAIELPVVDHDGACADGEIRLVRPVPENPAHPARNSATVETGASEEDPVGEVAQVDIDFDLDPRGHLPNSRKRSWAAVATAIRHEKRT
jgi:hypothetical protein